MEPIISHLQDVALANPCFEKEMESSSVLEHIFYMDECNAVLKLYIRCDFELMQLNNILPHWCARVSVFEYQSIKNKQGVEFIRFLPTREWDSIQKKIAHALIRESLKDVGGDSVFLMGKNYVIHNKKLNTLELQIVGDSITSGLQERF